MAAGPVALQRSLEVFLGALGHPGVCALHLPLRHLHPQMAWVENDAFALAIVEAPAAVSVGFVAPVVTAFNTRQLSLMKVRTPYGRALCPISVPCSGCLRDVVRPTERMVGVTPRCEAAALHWAKLARADLRQGIPARGLRRIENDALVFNVVSLENGVILKQLQKLRVRVAVSVLFFTHRVRRTEAVSRDATAACRNDGCKKREKTVGHTAKGHLREC